MKISTRMPSLRHTLLGLATLGLTVGATQIQAQTVYGLLATPLPTPTQSVVTFNATTPAAFTANVPITGTTVGAIVGLDVRPNTGQLFALGYNSTTQQAQLYILSPTTGVTTAVGSAITLNLGTDVSRIGFDFNPTVDRIRVTAGNGANFRLNPNNGALAATDGTLAYATGDTNVGQTPGVGSSAYTNSYIGSTSTTLYNLDEANSRLVTQNPPNDGKLNTVGALGVPTNGTAQVSDLDIYFNPTTGTNVAYMTTSVVSLTSIASTLYTVDLTTGAATAVGTLGSTSAAAVTDITFAIDRPASLPAVTGQLAYALAGSNLLTFDTSQPTLVRTSVGITGVDAAQTLVGLDVRPSTNSLYALGYNATAQTAQLYTINDLTGVARAVNAVPLALALGNGKVSFDFNPVANLIRVIGRNGANFRLNPADGSLAGTDTPLTYIAGDANAGTTPNIGAVAYTNSMMGATTTALYNYDLNLNVLTRQDPPNAGTLTTIGATGVTANATTPNVDMDIFYNTATSTNLAYLVANTGTGANTTLYTLNVTTGAATAVGAIGNGIAARDIAIAGQGGVTANTSARELAAGLSLYPNPVAGIDATVSFKLTQPTQVELTVFDALGRQVDVLHSGVLSAGNQTVRWNSAARSKGLYFVRLTLDGQPAGAQRSLVLN
ncbi:DUF4394 domain-containing protein [Hymenobacter crusticola]|uniref:Secretion system C-terminal sorting domain-containing protein n=1 Tax=Hymenobacter crusticola TaxID=1770526 RepID=A0A243WIE5_9BACT|nr:DUF4394 domain-containing protein [Hymenobacter crusticola]OUJ75598.1 hypothetical protein BXP70_06225 [Hymenobacter crusticola]